MQRLARHPHASEHFAELMGHFGQATNALSFLFSLLGTRWGVRCAVLPSFSVCPFSPSQLAVSTPPPPTPHYYMLIPRVHTHANAHTHSYVVRTLGLPATLRIFPCLLIVASIAAFLYPYLGVRAPSAHPSRRARSSKTPLILLSSFFCMCQQVLFFFVSILKALSYALNEPCKEMLYIPTSDTIR